MLRTFALLLLAGSAAFAADGYVVKVDAGTVYLDLGRKTGAAKGQTFVVFTEGEELKHPVSGKSLGRIETKVAEGEITQVAEEHSVGRLRDAAASAAPGQRVRIEGSVAPPAAAAPQASAPAGEQHVRPLWRSPGLEMEAVAVDVADIDGDGAAEIVLADDRRVRAYPEAAPAQGAWSPSCEFEDKTHGVKVVSLEALDLNADKKAEVFASLHNEFFGRVETVVLECRAGKLEKTATLPWLVRSYADAKGRRALAGQALVADRSFPFGAIYPVEFKDGSYRLGDEKIRVKRLEWIYSFAKTEGADNAPNALFYDANGKLRAQLGKKAWTSREPLGQTATRVRWQDRVLRFSPRLPTIPSDSGFVGVYAVRNVPKLGTLADSFGLYSRSELQRLKWNGLGLDVEWVADIDGYLADVVPGSDAPGAPVYAAVVGAGGRTAVYKFQP